MAFPEPDYVDLEWLGRSGVIGTAVLRTDRGAWLVDPGPTSALGGLERGLARLGCSLGDVRGLLLTHVHLDHAGAAGTIARQHPETRVFVHRRGAPHVIDPSRLLRSAGQLYGDEMEHLWGEVAPVPAASVQILDGGEALDLDGRLVEVAYTPGHASHHVSYFDRETASVFAGDTGGVFLAAAPQLVIPPTPPPDIDLDAWASSLAHIRQWQPRRLFVTHFGATEHPEAHMASLERQLATMSDLVRASLDEPGSDAGRAQRFVARVRADIRRFVAESEARQYDVAVPLDHCWYGLARYWRKRKGSEPGP